MPLIRTFAIPMEELGCFVIRAAVRPPKSGLQSGVRPRTGAGDGKKRRERKDWARLDSNQRRRKPTGLQPVSFGHSDTRPAGFGQRRSSSATGGGRYWRPENCGQER